MFSRPATVDKNYGPPSRSDAVQTVLATLYTPWELHSLLLLLKDLANITTDFEALKQKY